MGWFGGDRQSKCPRCGASVPFVISGGGGQDDLMRRSKVNVASSGRNPLCSNCMRAAHVSTAHTPPPAPPPTAQPKVWASPPPSSRARAAIVNRGEESSSADEVDFDAALQSAKRIASTFGKEIAAEDIEKLKNRFRQGGIAGDLDKQVGKVARGCGLTIALTFALLFVIGWLAGEQESTTPPPQGVDTTQPIPLPVPPEPTNASGATNARPLNSPGSWINSGDYPEAAIRAKREGTTGFRVEVSRAGRVTGCTIVRSSGHGDLDRATCSAITRRAFFTPARDAQGDPVPATYSNSVRWALPR